MSDPVDMDALAKRYIELWQEQLAKVSTDPSVMQAWQSVFETAAKTMGWSPDSLNAFTTTAQGADRASARGTKAPAPSSGDGGPDLADVLRRLDALEQRLAALETDQDGP